MMDAKIIHPNSVCDTKHAKECQGIYFLLQKNPCSIPLKSEHEGRFQTPGTICQKAPDGVRAEVLANGGL